MRTIVHRLAYFVTFILAATATWLYEQALSEWASARGYTGKLNAVVAYIVDAGFDGLVLAAFLIFLGGSLAFLIDEAFRRRANRGKDSARLIVRWQGKKWKEIVPTYNVQHCYYLQPHREGKYIWILFEQPVPKPHLFGMATKCAGKIRELYSSDRHMILELGGDLDDAEVLICVTAERARSPGVRRQLRNVWEDMVHFPELSLEFAYGEELRWRDRFKARLSEIVHRLRQWLPATSRSN